MQQDDPLATEHYQERVDELVVLGGVEDVAPPEERAAQRRATAWMAERRWAEEGMEAMLREDAREVARATHAHER